MELRLIDEVAARTIVDDGCPAGYRCAADFPAEADRIAAAMYLERVAAGLDPGRFGAYAIVVDETVVGGIGFHGVPDDAGRVEIGYGVVPSRRGEGQAKAALRLLVEQSARLGATLLVAETEPENHASSAVLRQAGFERVDAGATAHRFELPLM